MSCNNTPAPKCCAPPKKDCPPAPPACTNLPNTLTFTCPADDCTKKEEKPFCPPPEPKCVALGNAKPDDCGSAGAAASPPPATCAAPPPLSSSAPSGGCATKADNCCEAKPLTMGGSSGKNCN